MAYEPVVKSDQLDGLFEAILKLESVEDCYRFFEDLCTVHEMQDMGQRFEVARQLKADVTYHEIVERTGASTATISRVNRCLNYGAGGYRLALKRLEESAGRK
jgi:TrpR-related protein YerC/YecD